MNQIHVPAPVEQFEHRGHTVKIVLDDSPESPREWGNLGHMVCWHSRYNLGDEQPRCKPDEWFCNLACKTDATTERSLNWLEERYYDSPDYETRRQKIIARALDKVVILPLYLYDHGGITISVCEFGDLFDSGQVGYSYATKAMILKELGGKLLTKCKRERAKKMLRAEVAVYNQYLMGDVYGYIIEDQDDHTLDACWGFYGLDYCIEEAKLEVESRELLL